MKIGLLPLYLKLYDESAPEKRSGVDSFHKFVSDEFKRRGVEVVDVPVCRIKPEFEAAIEKFERERADAVVTLHLAYSPSLESSEALAKTKLPVIVLDTTPDYRFDRSSAISYNHGIHGVQDMCNLLRRNSKHFEIFAGHISHSSVIDETIGALRGAVMAGAMRSARVGLIGKPFAGMGDFSLPFGVLRETLGIEVIQFEGGFPAVTDEMIGDEYAHDSRSCDMGDVSYADYAVCERVALGVRGWIEKNRLTAFSMSFLDARRNSEFAAIPFAEACKAMARGIGYAGEGDVMTAAFVGALLSVYPETTFAEMFCPDWENGTVFVSHMGEYNPRCAAGKAKYILKKFPYTDAYQPTAFTAPLKPGNAVFACLAPDRDGRYMLIFSEVEMLCVPEGTDFDGCVSGWFKPNLPLAEFLRIYSKHGGIHHAAIVYGGSAATLSAFGGFMGWDVTVI